MNAGFFYAAITGVSMGVWMSVWSSLSARIHPLAALFFSELIAALFAIAFLTAGSLLPEARLQGSVVPLVFVAGMCVFAFDYFAFRAYGLGVPVSIGAPLMIGGGILVATGIGFLRGEQLTPVKCTAIALIIIGASLLASVSEKA